MELKQWLDPYSRQMLERLNRTIVELKPVLATEAIAQVELESNHRGIETVSNLAAERILAALESNHRGNETRKCGRFLTQEP